MNRSLTERFSQNGKKKLAAVFLTASLAMGGTAEVLAADGYGPGRKGVSTPDTSGYTYSDLITDAQSGQVREITQKGDEIYVEFNDRTGHLKMTVPENENIVDRFDPLGVDVRAIPKEEAQEQKKKKVEGRIGSFCLAALYFFGLYCNA